MKGNNRILKRIIAALLMFLLMISHGASHCVVSVCAQDNQPAADLDAQSAACPLAMILCTEESCEIGEGEKMDLTVQITGGCAPYTLLFTARKNAETEDPADICCQESLSFERDGIYTVAFLPPDPGEYTVTFGLSDHSGAYLQEQRSVWVHIAEPAGEPTEEPAAESIGESIEEPAEEPIEEPTEEPVEEPAEEPVEEPAEDPTEEITEGPIEETMGDPIEESTDVPAEEPIEESAQDPAEDSAQDPMEESDSNAPQVHITCDSAYAIVGETDLYLSAQVLGGTAPYTLLFTAAAGEQIHVQETLTYEQSGIYPLVFSPAAAGIYTIRIAVTDQRGAQALQELRIAAADRAAENEEIWAESVSGATLTGKWGRDLAAVANTQLGYQPSSTNFILDDSGTVHPYTRYGHLAGIPYGDWGAAFIGFCMDYANIPREAIPRNTDCHSWMVQLDGMGLILRETYMPAPGDMVFFGADSQITHVGIITDVMEDQFCTIEGSREETVSRFCYEWEDPGIMGYVSMVQAARPFITCRAAKLYQGDSTDLIPGDKIAFAVYVTGIARGTELSYDDGIRQITFRYNAAISEQTGYSAYIALADADAAAEDLENIDHYTFGNGIAEEIRFGDYNADGIVNAQEALDVVNAWLRKGEVLTDAEILTMNVNGDSRINTFDVLGIVEAFISNVNYGVVNIAVAQAAEL